MKSRPAFTICIFSFLTIGFSSCKESDNPVQPSATAELLPLKIGNQWTLDLAVYDSSNATARMSEITIQVLRDTMIQNDAWFITNSRNFGILRNSPQGLWLWDRQPALFFPYPATVGDSTRPFNTATVRVVSTNEAKTVPFGTLSCYHYRVVPDDPSGLSLNFYYSPGVGYVSYELAGSDARTHGLFIAARYQLKSYSLR
jgi:hypothetical protein